MPAKGFLIDTDVIEEHLFHKGTAPSFLETLMQENYCFTTVLNAGELFFRAKDEKEQLYIRKTVNALKVLGLHSRYSLSVNSYIDKVASVRDALFCATAELNKLIIVSLDKNRYKNSGVTAFYPSEKS